MTEKVEYIQVKDKADLARDPHSKGIINRNKNAYEKAIKRAKAAQSQRDQIRDTTRQINSLKCEMHEIKNLLKQLVDTQ